MPHGVEARDADMEGVQGLYTPLSCIVGGTAVVAIGHQVHVVCQFGGFLGPYFLFIAINSTTAAAAFGGENGDISIRVASGQ